MITEVPDELNAELRIKIQNKFAGQSRITAEELSAFPIGIVLRDGDGEMTRVQRLTQEEIALLFRDRRTTTLTWPDVERRKAVCDAD